MRTSSEFVARAMRESVGVRYCRSMISSWWPESRRRIGSEVMEEGRVREFTRRVWSLWMERRVGRDLWYLVIVSIWRLPRKG